MKKVLIIFLLLVKSLNANSVDYPALMQAISHLNVAAVENELSIGTLSREAKDQLLKVVDDLIAQEEKNNEWYKNHTALMQCGFGLVATLIAHNLGNTHEEEVNKGLLGFFAGMGIMNVISGLAKFFAYNDSYIYILAIKACILKHTDAG